MLTRIVLRNFRCFREVDLRLGPRTFLVGPNASGKTSLLQAIADPNQLDEKRDRKSGTEGRIGFELFAEDFHAHRDGDGRWTPRAPAQNSLVVRLDVDAMRQHAGVQEASALTRDGRNAANVLATLPRERQQAVAQELSRLIPAVGEVFARPSSLGHYRLVFRDAWVSDVWYEPQQVSDGTLLCLAFLLIPHIASPPELLCVEEPERGLHPYLLGEITTLLRRIANGEIGSRAVQVVVATQSPSILNFAAPEEVRFLTRHKDEVVVEEAPTGADDWRRAYQEYGEQLGDLWLAGSLGGVPGG